MNSAATTQQAADALLLAVRPRQGCWSENDYLWLTDHCTQLVELADGRIEELSWPTDTHQTVLAFLFRLFDRHIDALGGVVRFAALRSGASGERAIAHCENANATYSEPEGGPNRPPPDAMTTNCRPAAR